MCVRACLLACLSTRAVEWILTRTFWVAQLRFPSSHSRDEAYAGIFIPPFQSFLPSHPTLSIPHCELMTWEDGLGEHPGKGGRAETEH